MRRRRRRNRRHLHRHVGHQSQYPAPGDYRLHGLYLEQPFPGRFALGLAKGVGLRWKAMNVDFPTFEREAEFIKLMRKLWRGERELNHQSALALPGSATGALR